MTHTAKHAFVYERNRIQVIAENDPLIVTEQLEARLNCSRSMVYKLISQGELKALRFERFLWVPESALNAFLDEKAEQSFDVD